LLLLRTRPLPTSTPLSLHDALPIFVSNMIPPGAQASADVRVTRLADYDGIEQKLRERIKKKLLPEAQVELVFERRALPLEPKPRSEEHTSELQSRSDLVCRLLLEKK